MRYSAAMDPAISGRSYLILAGVSRGVVWEDLSSCQSVTLNVDSQLPAVIGAKRIRTCEAGSIEREKRERCYRRIRLRDPSSLAKSVSRA